MLTAGECRWILERLAAITLAERRHVRAGLHPDGAPTIVAGAIILLGALELFGLDQVEVLEHDILRGAPRSGCGSAGLCRRMRPSLRLTFTYAALVVADGRHGSVRRRVWVRDPSRPSGGQGNPGERVV